MDQRGTLFNSFNIILCILITINIVGCFVVKDTWIVGRATYQDWTSRISIVLYGVVLIMMIPSFFKISPNTTIVKVMVIYLILSLLYGYDSHNNIQLGFFSKKLLIFFSFIYFDIAVRDKKISKPLLYLYILSMAFFVLYNVTQANVLGRALESGEAKTGQSTSLGMVFLLPLVAYVWKPKYIGYFYILTMIACLISMRRTSIIAGLMFFPFMYKYLKQSISRRMAIYIFILFGIIAYYLINKYWDILVLRFNDMFNPSEYNETYGSGRSEWFRILYNRVTNSGNLFIWLFGYGIDAAGDTLTRIGYPFRAVHSDFLELFHDTGLVGIVIYILLLIKFTLRTYKASSIHKSIVLVSFVVIAICGSVSSFINNPMGLSIPLFLCLILHNPSYLETGKGNNRTR